MSMKLWMLTALVPAVMAFAFQPASADELGGEEGFAD